ncbi:MAG: DHH family phosphoesterase [Thermacetogeniaceae bacterium]
MIEEVKDLLLKGDNFLLASHLNPDGDAIGSLLGLGMALKKLDKKVAIASPYPTPQAFSFLPGYELLQPPSSLGKQAFDIGIVLDCTELERTGEEVKELLRKTAVVVNIDHHISNKGFGDLKVVDPHAAATGELIFEMLEKMEIPLTPEIATNLYVAIVTDTGSFQHRNTTERCHRNAASLLRLGADHARVYQFLYEERSLKSIRLLEKCLQTLSVSEDGLIAWMTVSQEHLIETGCTIEDCENLIDYPKSIKGVEIGILFKQISDDEVRVSFRSKNYADVNALAASFGGGGHERAAGCTIHGSLKDVEKMVLTATINFLHNIKKEVVEF